MGEGQAGGGEGGRSQHGARLEGVKADGKDECESVAKERKRREGRESGEGNIARGGNEEERESARRESVWEKLKVRGARARGEW